MNPRAVLMAKAVADSGVVDVALQGNILAPFGRGWTNNSVNYFTLTEAALWEPGNPFMGQPCVYYYNEGQPRYRWFPVRPSNWWVDQGSIPVTGLTVRAITPSEVSASMDPPPIGTLAPY